MNLRPPSVTLQLIEMIPKFDWENIVEWTRVFSEILQLSWPFVSESISGFERPEPILGESRKGEGNISDFDDRCSSHSDVTNRIREV